ncbi:MAG: carboxypeptidase regulatory-like domain-containing protein [Planctomycetota bacterium]
MLRSFGEVCQVVGYAHGQGVIHRDLKPSNVMVGSHGETLLLDWGLSKPLASRDPHQVAEETAVEDTSPGIQIESSGSTPTRQGSFIGTIQYASPEQLRGDIAAIGPASDIFSLGVVLAEMLTGRTLLGKVSSVGEALSIVESDKLPRLASIKRNAPAGLVAIAEKAMSAKLENRYRTADELADDVEAWVTGNAISSYREPVSDRVLRWVKRNRVAASFAIGLVLTSLIALLITVPILNLARIRADNARIDAQLSETRTMEAEQETKQALGESQQKTTELQSMVAKGGISNAFRLLSEYRPSEAIAELDRVRDAVPTSLRHSLPWRLIESQGSLPVVELPEPESGRCLDIRWSRDETKIFGLIETAGVGGDGLMLKTWSWPSGELVSKLLVFDQQSQVASIIGEADAVIAMTHEGARLFDLSGYEPRVLQPEFTRYSQSGRFGVSPSNRYLAWPSIDFDEPAAGETANTFPNVVMINAQTGKLLLNEKGVSPTFVGDENNETLIYRDYVQNVIKLVELNGDNVGQPRLMNTGELPMSPQISPGVPNWLAIDDPLDRCVLHLDANRLYLGQRHPLYRTKWIGQYVSCPSVLKSFCWIDPGRTYAVAFDDRLAIYDFATGDLKHKYSIQVTGQPVTSPTGRFIAFTGQRGKIKVLNRFAQRDFSLAFPFKLNRRLDVGDQQIFTMEQTDTITHVAVSNKEESACLVSGNIAVKVDLQTGNILGAPLILDREVGKLAPDVPPGSYRLQCFRGSVHTNYATTWTPFSWSGEQFGLNQMTVELRSQRKGGPVLRDLGFSSSLGQADATTDDQQWRFVGDDKEVRIYEGESDVALTRFSSQSGHFIGVGQQTGSLYFVDGMVLQALTPDRMPSDKAERDIAAQTSITVLALSQARSQNEFIEIMTALDPAVAKTEWIAKTWNQHVASEAQRVLTELVFVGMTIDDFHLLLDFRKDLKDGVSEKVLEILKTRIEAEGQFARAWAIICDHSRSSAEYSSAQEIIEGLEWRIDGVRRRVAVALSELRLGDQAECRRILHRYNNSIRWKHPIESVVLGLSGDLDPRTRGILNRFADASEDQRKRIGSSLPLIDELIEQGSKPPEEQRKSSKTASSRAKSSDSPRSLPKTNDQLVKLAIDQLKADQNFEEQRAAIVVLVVESDLIETVEYRCYRGRGFSGVRRFKTSKPYVTLEREADRSNGVRRIVLDAGPNYELVELDAQISPGEVTDLGVVRLMKVPKGKAFIVRGSVADLERQAVGGCEVKLGTKDVQADKNGNFEFVDVPIGKYQLSATSPGFRAAPFEITVRNDGPDEIKQDLTVFRPRTVTVKYAIGQANDTRLSGPDIEEGELVVPFDSWLVKFSPGDQAKERLKVFLDDTRLGLMVMRGDLTLNCGYGPLYFSDHGTKASFDSVEIADDASAWSQKRPAISGGSLILIRGNPSLSKGGPQMITPYYVKLKFVSMDIMQP